jgi:hypothetical protein
MKKSIFVTIIIMLISFSEIKTATSNYNQFTNTIFCNSYECIHEVGHYIDFNNGLVSSSKEFREYFKDEMFYGINGYPNKKWGGDVNIITIDVVVFGWGGWKEFYAYNFERYYGCENMMPESMREFYDFETAYKELRKYGFDHEKMCPIIKEITHGVPMEVL